MPRSPRQARELKKARGKRAYADKRRSHTQNHGLSSSFSRLSCQQDYGILTLIMLVSLLSRAHETLIKPTLGQARSGGH